MKLTVVFAPIALFLLSACAALPTTQVVTNSPSDFSFEAGSFQALLNSARQIRGLAPLQNSKVLAASAQAHANDMSVGGFFSHTSSDGKSVGQRAKANGYGFCWISENISLGRSTEAETFARWMASAGHRKNMLAREPTEYGLAVAPGNYRVLVLATPGC